MAWSVFPGAEAKLSIRRHTAYGIYLFSLSSGLFSLNSFCGGWLNGGKCVNLGLEPDDYQHFGNQ